MYNGLREKFRSLEELGWILPGGRVAVRYQAEGPKGHSYKRAAVMFLISQNHDGDFQVLLTKRSDTVRIHKGEVCLPGGHQDNSSEGPVETALREASEEIQLDPGLVEVIAVLPQFPSGETGLLAVTPVVFTLLGRPDDLSLVPNDEVEYTFWAPLSIFLESSTLSYLKLPWRDRWTLVHWFQYTGALTDTDKHIAAQSDDNMSTIEEQDLPIGYKSHNIWGLTASICVVVSAIVLDRMPEFPSTTFVIQNIDESKQVVQLQQTALSARQLTAHRRNGTGLKSKL